MLYRYLNELDGICASHTSATGMGTDWRDNDPDVEPIVEIYQGDRMSYEKQDAPRAGYDPKGDASRPTSPAGSPRASSTTPWTRATSLGFQSSSDHWSTHISFCIVLAEKHDRAGILDAIKQAPLLRRHGQHHPGRPQRQPPDGRRVQGSGAPTLDVHVIGTADLDEVVVLRDSKVVAVLKAGQARSTRRRGPIRSRTRASIITTSGCSRKTGAGVGIADVDRLGAVTAIGGAARVG